jgi:DNA replication factor GINS
MKLEDLRAAQTRERATDGLQELRDSFYGEVADYLAELKERREAAAGAADDPFGDPEVQELTDKIETAEQVAEAIYERRMGKLVKQASLAAAGMPDDANGLTAEERDLYDDLVERIETNKAHVLDVISGDAETDHGESASPPGESPAKPPEGDQPTAESSAAAAMGGGLDDGDDQSEPEPSADPETPEAIADDRQRVTGADEDATGDTEAADESPDADGVDVDRTTVRVTHDVGEIFGVDERPYTLEAEDVVTLPDENAAPLVEKGAAEKLE